MYLIGVYKNLPSSGAIAGIVVATVLALVFFLAAIALLVLLILVKKERRTHPEYSWFEGVKVVLDVSIPHTTHTTQSRVLAYISTASSSSMDQGGTR